MYRYNPDEDYSPGNFRQPTLEKCQEHLNWWAGQGVTKLSDFNSFDMTNEERALEKIRWSEAKYYWDRYDKQLGRHSTDSYMYRKPLLSIPRKDAEDYGDFEAVSPAAARNYLYNFFTRQADRTEKGLPLQDVEIFPWKPRYDECVAILGQEEVDKIEADIFDRAGLMLYAARRNPEPLEHTNCNSGFIYEHGGCPLCPPPVACLCSECRIPWQRNPRYRRNQVANSLMDMGLSYSYNKPRRNSSWGHNRPSMPW